MYATEDGVVIEDEEKPITNQLGLQGRAKLAMGLHEEDALPSTVVDVPTEYSALREADGDIKLALVNQEVHARGSHVDDAAIQSNLKRLRAEAANNLSSTHRQ